MTWPDGSSYHGSWEGGSFEGVGTLVMMLGDYQAKYQGSWTQGKQDGNGTYYYTDGRIYKGAWKEGKQAGKGSMTWPDGDSYVGDWEAGVRQGWGAYYWNNGNSYQGRILANQMHGQALHFKWGDGAKFECKELTDCFNKGSIQKSNGKFKSVNRWRRSENIIEKEYNDGWYVGEITKRKFRKGRGTFYYLNGDRYVGIWNRDKPDGKGTYYYKNGDRFEGLMKAGKFEGKGKFFFGSLDKFEGDFTNGK